MKLVLILIGITAALGLVAYGWGSLIPREHVASRRVVLRSTTPEDVWARIMDPAAAPQWRRDLSRITRLPDRDGHEVWREESSSGDALDHETLESVPPSRLVRRIVDESMFGGTWTILIAADGAGASVRVTEDGWVGNPIFRIVAKYVMGHERTMNAYLADLAQSFGESATLSS